MKARSWAARPRRVRPWRQAASTLVLGAAALCVLPALGGCHQAPTLTDLPPHRMDLVMPTTPTTTTNPDAQKAHGKPSVGLDPWAPRSGYREWTYIVIHHSATEAGSAADFDKYHRRKGWDELGYHFVIDNGRGGQDGRIEVGCRWQCQKWGAHVGGTPDNEYNNHGIGICLVGDLTGKMPTPAQLESLRTLVVHLARTYHIPARNIIGHRDAPNAKTACPGDAFHKQLHQVLKPLWACDLPQ